MAAGVVAAGGVVGVAVASSERREHESMREAFCSCRGERREQVKQSPDLVSAGTEAAEAV